MKERLFKQNTHRRFSPTAWGRNGQEGFTLLIAILVVSIVLAIGLSILNITLKEYLLSGVARESTIALNAADAGMECGLYWDRSSQGGQFNIGAASNITCMGQATTSPASVGSGTSRDFVFTWGTPPVCAKVSVTKYFDRNMAVPMGGNLGSCPAGVTCTRIVSLGYNNGCTQLNSLRTVERGLRARY